MYYAKQWGFKGFVVTDYTGINEMEAHGLGDLKTVSALALNAGIPHGHGW
jgi:beta-glucosidase